MRSLRPDDPFNEWLPEDVFAVIAPRLDQLALDHRLHQAVMDHVFATSHAAVFRAAHSSDFIHRLIEVTPSLTARQRDELLAIADDLIWMARRGTWEAYERGKQLQADARLPRPDALDELQRELADEWQGIKQDVNRLKRWLAK